MRFAFRAKLKLLISFVTMNSEVPRTRVSRFGPLSENCIKIDDAVLVITLPPAPLPNQPYPVVNASHPPSWPPILLSQGPSQEQLFKEWEAKFKLRLERAWDKNFAYIRAKDLRQEQEQRQYEQGSIHEHTQHQQSLPHQQPYPEDAPGLYIGGLPLDMQEEELQILLSKQGKIKRIKFYVDAHGHRKGDCLVTFARSSAGAVERCIALYHNANIGDGFVLHVSRATSKSSYYNNPNVHSTPHGDYAEAPWQHHWLPGSSGQAPQQAASSCSTVDEGEVQAVEDFLQSLL